MDATQMVPLVRGVIDVSVRVFINRFGVSGLLNDEIVSPLAMVDLFIIEPMANAKAAIFLQSHLR